MNDYTVKVIETIPRGKSSRSVRMEKPAGFTFTAGQWARFAIAGGGEGMAKPLSFSSSPTEPFLEFTKRITGSDFSAAIDKLRRGDSVAFKGPAGQMTYEGGLEAVVFLAGGIGITPVRSVLRFCEDRKVPGKRLLIYANKVIDDIAFLEEFQKMEKNNRDFSMRLVLETPHEGWTGSVGFITEQVIRDHVPDLQGQTFYLCGPPPMVNALTKALNGMGVGEDRLVKEKLVGYDSMN